MNNMFEGMGLSIENYDSLLAGWSSLSSLQSGVDFNGGKSQYCAEGDARSKIINQFKWNIIDGGENCFSATSAIDALSHSPFKITMYPMPSTDIMNVSMDATTTIKELKFYDMSGRLLKVAKDSETQQKNTYKIDVSDFKAGIYFLRIFDSSGRMYEKQVLVN